MIIRWLEGFTGTNKMVFEQLRERFLSSNKKRSHSKKKEHPNPPPTQSKAELERQIIKKADELIAEKKYKLALEAINLTIENGISTNQILFRKALALSKNKQFQEAHEIWAELSNLKNKPKLAASAKQSLNASKKIELQNINSTKRLINQLHATAQKYNQNLDHIPKSSDWSTAADFTPFVLKQTEATRNAQLPKLSASLIDQALAGGLESPQLLNDKARSIGMLGQQKTALGLLGHLKKTSKSKQLINSINQNIHWINSNSKLHKSKSNLYLAVQARSIAASNKLDTTFLPDDTEIGPKTRVKFLIFRKARATLVENPQACLYLVDSILDYSQGDLAALLLKGEALAALQEIDEALEIWRELTRSKDENIANKASELIGQLFSQEALAISASETPKKAILFFIKQHLDRNVVPTTNKEINTILQRLAPTDTQSSDIEIQQHQLQLMLNAHILEYLEARFRQRNRPATSSPAQKPGAISKTAPKAG